MKARKYALRFNLSPPLTPLLNPLSLSLFILWFRAVRCNCDVTARFLSNCQTNFKLLKVAAAVAHNINIIITVAFWLLWCALKVFAQRLQVKSFLMKFCLLFLFSMLVEGSTTMRCSCKYPKNSWSYLEGIQCEAVQFNSIPNLTMQLISLVTHSTCRSLFQFNFKLNWSHFKPTQGAAV